MTVVRGRVSGSAGMCTERHVGEVAGDYCLTDLKLQLSGAASATTWLPSCSDSFYSSLGRILSQSAKYGPDGSIEICPDSVEECFITRNTEHWHVALPCCCFHPFL